MYAFVGVHSLQRPLDFRMTLIWSSMLLWRKSVAQGLRVRIRHDFLGGRPVRVPGHISFDEAKKFKG